MSWFVLLGQISIDQPVPQWTVLGLLALVLGGVGVFLRSFIPGQMAVFENQLNLERTTWLGLLESERAVSEARVSQLIETFNNAVVRLDSNDKDLSAAIRSLEAQLKGRG